MVMKKKTQDLEKIKKKQVWIKFACEFKFLARPLLRHYSFLLLKVEKAKRKERRRRRRNWVKDLHNIKFYITLLILVVFQILTLTRTKAALFFLSSSLPYNRALGKLPDNHVMFLPLRISQKPRALLSLSLYSNYYYYYCSSVCTLLLEYWNHWKCLFSLFYLSLCRKFHFFCGSFCSPDLRFGGKSVRRVLLYYYFFFHCDVCLICSWPVSFLLHFMWALRNDL